MDEADGCENRRQTPDDEPWREIVRVVSASDDRQTGHEDHRRGEISEHTHDPAEAFVETTTERSGCPTVDSQRGKDTDNDQKQAGQVRASTGECVGKGVATGVRAGALRARAGVRPRDFFLGAGFRVFVRARELVVRDLVATVLSTLVELDDRDGTGLSSYTCG